MRRLGFLFDQVLEWENLLEATRRAARGKRTRSPVARFLGELEPQLLALQDELRRGLWRPGPYDTFHIRDPKPRCISAAPFRDRVVHHALMRVLDPVFERYQIGRSFACRRGLGTHRAVQLARAFSRKASFFLKGDVVACFETIDHAVLKSLLRRIIKDARVLDLLDRIIDSTGSGCGLPIGNLTSQYLANHYLGVLDHYVTEKLRVGSYLRYMDDFVLFARCKHELHDHRARIRAFLADFLRLELKESVSTVSPTYAGLPFLGFLIFPGTVRLQGARRRRTLRRLSGRISVNNAPGAGDEALIASFRSSIAHMQHADTQALRRGWFG
jgi:retron-type reverse transcriptase